ncbi:TPA: DUF2523 family protein [Pseudomonas aeruginosa]|uniref:DUF2523 family protein n=1 Tax=Pseudomonas aeruginosa TaxID=287 RepID=UPI000F869C80|nr:DUF2523 family protein [Pseudomonas aeruginosa]MBI8564558.1 DUF2523 domain-containing protein [Pseudomonas aeruginosa]RUH94368.1 DUF2523 domain-containing protein [Pseudomonas aeruginosa]
MDIPFLSDIIQWFQSIWDFMYQGVYDFCKDFLILLTKMAFNGWLEFKLFTFEVAYKAFNEIAGQLRISQYLQAQYGSIPGDVRSALAFFGVPEALNTIFSAMGSRFMMKFIPLIGR